jgi:CheY-like chemotaxis protein
MAAPKILIVDDDEIIRTLLRHALGGEIYSLLEAHDGRQALEVVDREMPDLVLLDVMMPEMDGIEVLRRLKSQQRTSHIPVIIITALTSEADVATSLDEGAIDHISKPFSELIVKTRVRAALRNRTGPAAAESPAPKRGRCIGFLGVKGGVGSTTTAVNTALAIVAPQRSVVVVELRESPGTAAMQLGLSSGSTLDNVLDQPLGSRLNSEMVASHLRLHRSGVRLLAAPTTLMPRREVTVRHQSEDLIRVLAEMFDFVILDLPSAATPPSRAVLNGCDYLVLTLELEATCLALSRPVLDRITSDRQRPDSMGALLVLHDVAAGTLIPVGYARSQLTCPVIGVIPPCGAENLQALKTGVPVLHSAPSCAAAVAYSEFGARLMADRIVALTF